MIVQSLLSGLLLFQLAAANNQSPLVGRFLEADESQPLTSYRAERHLRAFTRGGKISGEMDVLTTFDEAHGFTFEVLTEHGSGLIRHHVLLEALRTEQRTVQGGAKAGTALTPVNYDFSLPSPQDDSAPRLDVRARRKSPMLVNGTLFLDPDAELIRVEGELAERPSFWTRRVQVTRRYDRIAGVHVPVAMESVADIRIVGASVFEMSYRYLEINGQRLE